MVSPPYLEDPQLCCVSEGAYQTGWSIRVTNIDDGAFLLGNGGA